MRESQKTNKPWTTEEIIDLIQERKKHKIAKTEERIACYLMLTRKQERQKKQGQREILGNRIQRKQEKHK